MTISKTDLDAWIERKAEQYADAASMGVREDCVNDFSAGAQLLAPLLLQAYAAMKQTKIEMGSTVWKDEHVYFMVDQALSQIEAAVKGGDSE